MKSNLRWPWAALLLTAMACGGAPSGPGAPATAPAGEPSATVSEPQGSAFDLGRSAFGFFPSPPEPTFESVLQHFADLGEHADFILVQPNIPWEDFVDGVEGDSQAREDLRNQITLARQNGLEWVFVVDPLNGLNRRQFFNLPAGWDPTFANPDVRAAYINFSLWVLAEFQPRYLGLASEINTYMDAHPDDVEHFVSLYVETYDAVKARAPETQLFVTFQWDDLNNMFKAAAEGRQAGHTNWEQVEAFEPRLDVWAISSYPYFIFNGGTPIPADYYTPLLGRTHKPLAVAEGGFASRPVGPIQVSPQDQVAYLEAVHDQLGGRLSFWVYLVLNDLNMDAIGDMMRQQGRAESDIETLSMFASLGLRRADGAPKPALQVWGRLRRPTEDE